tara:strand:- start:707 stop:2545 length:1839 start_codon:yes stop_codon:yes gene_type:complete
MSKIITLLFFSLFIIGQGFTQSDIVTIDALAKQAEADGENQKAITYYEELYSKTEAENYYVTLVNLYIQENDFSSADKLVKKRIKRFPNRFEYIVDRGHIADQEDDKKSAERYYKEAIDAIGSDEQIARTVANQFIKYNKYNEAERAYTTARKNTRNEQLFRFEIANVYAHQGKTSEMIEEYLNILEGNRGYIQTIQNLFQRVLNPDPEGKQMDLLKNQLLKRIQKNSDNEIFSELLVWLYIQDQNFYAAFIQAKALDRRFNEDGKRIFSLGELSLSNNDFETAETAFQYIIDLGDSKPYYLQSKMKLVEVLKEKVISNPNYAAEDLQKLKKKYEQTIADLGKSSYTLPLIRGLANLNAYYIDSISVAVKLLEEASRMTNIPKQTKAALKIDLADLMLLKDEIWEASLLYSQVEKEFKYDEIGDWAKFKNSKIAFYTGDFFWAQAQLNVLKGSTSKLIANDAMQLSLLITDNVGLDSIVEPLEMYAFADLMIFKKDYDLALQTLDSIPKFFPSTSLKDEILFAKYQIFFKKRDYEKAAGFLEDLISGYAEDILGDDALFALAKLHEEKLNNKEKAMELFKTLITTYPGSLFVVESRKKFRELRGDFSQDEIN